MHVEKPFLNYRITKAQNKFESALKAEAEGVNVTWTVIQTACVSGLCRYFPSADMKL